MYDNVMVPLDGSPLAECVLPHVSAVSRCQVKTVSLVRVVDLARIPVVLERGSRRFQAKLELSREALEQQEKSQAEDYLAALADRLKSEGVSCRKVVLVGNAAACLLDYAERTDVDLIVMATHGRSGVSRWIWGSVADRVLHGSRAPVLLVSPPGCRLEAGTG